jgi:accessory colonization factor AcfC
MIDPITYGFTHLGKCKSCSGNAEKYTLGIYTLKILPKKNWFKLYENKANIAYGKTDQILDALIKHHVIELTPAA